MCVSADGRFCISSNGGNSASINASKLSGNSSTRSSTHIPKPQHLQRPNQIPTSCQSSILRVVEQTEENKDDDYDQLAPANKECNVINNSAGVHYACTNLVAELREKRTRQQPSNSRRSPKNSMVIKSDPTISLPSSLPGTPRLVQRKVLSHCSYSGKQSLYKLLLSVSSKYCLLEWGKNRNTIQKDLTCTVALM